MNTPGEAPALFSKPKFVIKYKIEERGLPEDLLRILKSPILENDQIRLGMRDRILKKIPFMAGGSDSDTEAYTLNVSLRAVNKEVVPKPHLAFTVEIVAPQGRPFDPNLLPETHPALAIPKEELAEFYGMVDANDPGGIKAKLMTNFENAIGDAFVERCLMPISFAAGNVIARAVDGAVYCVLPFTYEEIETPKPQIGSAAAQSIFLLRTRVKSPDVVLAHGTYITPSPVDFSVASLPSGSFFARDTYGNTTHIVATDHSGGLRSSKSLAGLFLALAGSTTDSSTVEGVHIARYVAMRPPIADDLESLLQL